MQRPWRLRAACDHDALEIAALIDRVFRAYGDRLAPRRGDRDLTSIETHYWNQGAAMVVLETPHTLLGGGEIIGVAAMTPVSFPSLCALRRFYVDERYRRSGGGSTLIRWAISWAALRGFQNFEIWSDTRFSLGHRFFERVGFKRTGELRSLTDGAAPYEEFRFVAAVDALAT